MKIDQNTLDHQGKIKRIVKILVVGDDGKMSLIRRYVQSYFSDFYKLTIGVDFATKDIDYEEYTTVSLQLWDIADQEFGGEMTHVYFKEACAAFVVFDLLRPQTFDNASKWKKISMIKFLLLRINQFHAYYLEIKLTFAITENGLKQKGKWTNILLTTVLFDFSKHQPETEQILKTHQIFL